MVVEALPWTARFDRKAILKDSILAAFVALVLAAPIVGVQTVETDGNLSLKTRMGSVIFGAVAVFCGRFVLRLVLAGGAFPLRAGSQARFAWIGAFARRHATLIVAFGVAFAIALPFLPFTSRYEISVATNIVIYVMLGWGLNVVVGLAGLLDLGYVAFYAVGAYSFALFAQWFGLSFWQALPISGLLAALFGFVLGFPVLRLRGDYLAIVTLGFGEIIHTILQNWVPVTNGPSGIGGIPSPTLFGMPFQHQAPPGGMTFHQFFGLPFNPTQKLAFLYYVVLGLALITNFFTLRLRRLPIGRAWEALREDEIACRALGINPTSVKLSAFTIGAMLGGFAGAFFATKQNFISPESFTFAESAIILAIVVLGGMGSQLGVVLAAIVLEILPELGSGFAQYRMLIFGLAMVAIMVWRPRGLLTRREPTLRLNRERKSNA